MKHLRKFELENGYLQAKDSFTYPTVSYIVEKDIVHYMKKSNYEFVDLGLPSGLKWAAWNVGATKPEESGLYFAWGEDKGYVVTLGTAIDASNGEYNVTIKNADDSVTEKTFADDFSDYKYYDVATSTYTKYNDTDTLTTLAKEDDGCYLTENSMRMPTKAECEELTANTISTWTKNYNGSGINGMTFTSKTNGNSIFVPFSGVVFGREIMNLGFEGSLWSSSRSSNVGDASFLGVVSIGSLVGDTVRYIGMPLRAVRP